MNAEAAHEIPMSAIEVRDGQEPSLLYVPQRWTVHDLSPLEFLAQRMGWESCRPTREEAVFAFRPCGNDQEDQLSIDELSRDASHLEEKGHYRTAARLYDDAASRYDAIGAHAAAESCRQMARECSLQDMHHPEAVKT